VISSVCRPLSATGFAFNRHSFPIPNPRPPSAGKGTSCREGECARPLARGGQAGSPSRRRFHATQRYFVLLRDFVRLPSLVRDRLRVQSSLFPDSESPTATRGARPSCPLGAQSISTRSGADGREKEGEARNVSRVYFVLLRDFVRLPSLVRDRLRVQSSLFPDSESPRARPSCPLGAQSISTRSGADGREKEGEARNVERTDLQRLLLTRHHRPEGCTYQSFLVIPTR
jgi:hypothetical protein